MSVEWNLQVAIYTALSADATLLALATGGIHDAVPAKRTYPYVVIGDDTLTAWDTKTWSGTNAALTFHIWSQAKGRKQIKQIGDAIYNVLHRQSLTVTGATRVLLRYLDSTSFVEPDGATRHGVVRYNLIVQHT